MPCETRNSLISICSKKGVLILIPVVSAFCVSIALSAANWDLLTWFVLAPYLYTLKRGGVAGAILPSFLFGYAYGLSTFAWLPQTQSVSLLHFLLLIVPTFSLCYLPFGPLYRMACLYLGSYIIIVGPCMWVMLEWVRANLFFLALPWNFLGHSQYQNLSIIQIADITGAYGITFLIVMVNEALSRILAYVFKKRKDKATVLPSMLRQKSVLIPLVTSGIVMLAVLVYGLQKKALPTSVGSIRAAVVQANVLAVDTMSAEEKTAHLHAYKKLSLEAAKEKPEVIFWPASSLPGELFRSKDIQKTVVSVARETEAYLLAGGAGIEKMTQRKEGQLPYSNSEFLFNSQGRLKQRYNKIRLVPFNEYLPLQEKIKWPSFITALELSFIPGKEFTLFEVGEAKFGTPICWESMFPELFRGFVNAGANLMVNVSNEGFTGRTSAPYQTLASSVFRAVENRVGVVRAATTGVSCFIDVNGAIVERIQDTSGADIFIPGFMVRDVPLYRSTTLYTKYGDVFTFTAIGVAVISLIFSAIISLRLRHAKRISDE
jgi:apolipoprotein N-acyltransferase